METVCETVSFQDVLSGFGRSDVGTQYHAGSYGWNSSVKSDQREKVVDFILPYFKDNEKIKLLSMPGESWSFETMLVGAHRKTQIVAIERSATIFHRSRRAMPAILGSNGNDHFQLQDRTVLYGSAELQYSRVTMNTMDHRKECHKVKGWGCGKKNFRSNRLLMISAETYMTMLTTDYGATMLQKKDFNDRFYSRNAVWLDFTSQLCRSVEETIANIPFCLDSGKTTKPVVLTFMNARDSFRGADKRVQRVLDLQPALTYGTHWTYVGNRGTPMLTICATVAA